MKPFVLQKNSTARQAILANLVAHLGRLPDTKSWRIEIFEDRKKRSDAQLGALFGVAYREIMEATGLQGDEEKRSLHRDMCGEFFGWVPNDLGGFKPARTTTTNERGDREVIDTKVQADMFYFIQRRAAEYGIFVSDPDPMYFRSQEGRQ